MPENVHPDDIDETEQDEESELLSIVSCTHNRVCTLQLTVDRLVHLVSRLLLAALTMVALAWTIALVVIP